MITYKAGRVEEPDGETEFFCAMIDVAGDSRTGPHGAAIQCWGIDHDEAVMRRTTILKALMDSPTVAVTL